MRATFFFLLLAILEKMKSRCAGGYQMTERGRGVYRLLLRSPLSLSFSFYWLLFILISVGEVDIRGHRFYIIL